MTSTAKKKNRKQRRAETGKSRRAGLGPEQIVARKLRLRGIDPHGPVDGVHLPTVDRDGNPQTFAASEPMIDARFITDRLPDGGSYTYLNPAAVPSGYVRCRKCGHESPPQCISAKGICIDCRYYDLDRYGNLPGSTSAVSIARLKASRCAGEVRTPEGIC